MSVEINVTDQIVEIEVAAGASVQPTWGNIAGTLSNQTDLQNALNAKVPYSGATGNVNLGEYELKAGQLTFDTSPTGTATVATMRWNDTTGLTETTLKGGSVVLKNGVDLVARVVNKVSPNTTLTKAAYQAVRVSGAQGQRLAVAFAQANNDNNSADTIGLVTETIATNQEGFIMTVGQLEGINTTGSLQGETWVDGDVLYLSPTTAGALTNVKPVAPQHLVIIGYVEYAHPNNGKIYVKVMNGWELGELHDVNTTGATNGSVLKYNGSIWVPSSDIDTGITTLNTLTALSQTFATGTSGTDFNISSATSTHTFNLPSASATNRGLLTSADWTTFNNKQNALTNPVTGTGVSGQVAYFTGATTQTSNAGLVFNGTNRLTIDGGTTGYLVGPTGEILIGEDAGGVYIGYGFGVSPAIPINYGSTGTTSHIWRANGSERMRLHSTGNLVLGGTASTDNGQRLQVTGDGYFSGSVVVASAAYAYEGISLRKNLTGLSIAYGVVSAGAIQSDVTSQAYYYESVARTQATTFTLSQLYHYSANQSTFGAGSTVTSQYGFFAQSTLIGATNNYGFYGNIASGTGRWNLYMNGTADNYLAGSLGIGTTSLSGISLGIAKSMTGATVSRAIHLFGTVQSDVTIFATGFSSKMNVASGFTLPSLVHFYSDQGTISGTLTNQYGFAAESTLIGATNNYGFFGSIPAGTGRWNLYMNGTAANYLNGSLGVGTTTMTYSFNVVNTGATYVAGFRGGSSSYIVVGDTSLGGESGINLRNSTGQTFVTQSGSIFDISTISGVNVIRFQTTGIEAARITATNRNFHIGTFSSDSGERLQVNGTMKVTGASTFSDVLSIGASAPLGNERLNVTFTNSGGIVAARIHNLGTTANTSTQINLTTNTNVSGGAVSSVIQSIGTDTSGNTAMTFGNSTAGTFSEKMRLAPTGNLLINSTTDAGFRLDVNGTMRVSGASTFNDAMTVNSSITTRIVNITSNTLGTASTRWIGSDGGANGVFINAPTGGNVYLGIANNNVVNVSASNVAVTGAATFSSSVTAASYTINDAGNITIGTTTGTKIGTATSQKIGFWNATPIVQPTTAVAAAAFVANTGTAVNDASTFDGYTMAQIVKALRNAGLLA